MSRSPNTPWGSGSFSCPTCGAEHQLRVEGMRQTLYKVCDCEKPKEEDSATLIARERDQWV